MYQRNKLILIRVSTSLGATFTERLRERKFLLKLDKIVGICYSVGWQIENWRQKIGIRKEIVRETKIVFAHNSMFSKKNLTCCTPRTDDIFFSTWAHWYVVDTATTLMRLYRKIICGSKKDQTPKKQEKEIDEFIRSYEP